MGSVRTWWPPVVLGVAIACCGIGVMEVGFAAAPSTPRAASVAPERQPSAAAPAAIEQLEGEPESVVPARSTPSRSTVAPEDDDEADDDEDHEERTRPTPRVTPRPVRVIAPRPTPTTPTAPPAATPSPVPRATPSPRPTPQAVRPADVLDLRAWKLTLPAGRRHDPMELRQPHLGLAGNGSYFRLRPDRGVMFRAPVGGVTTENSKYPRTELREMTSDGRREAAWSSRSGRHVMTLTQAITATPRAKPHVVAGQVHDDEDDVVMVRLEGRRLFVESDGDDVGVLDPAYRLGRRFVVSLEATSAGIRVTYNGSRTVHVPAVGRGWYFKAGCYVQSNPDRGDRPAAYGEVVIYRLAVRHS